MAKKKLASKPPMGATWDGKPDHSFNFQVGMKPTELMGNRQPKPDKKMPENYTIKKTKFAAGGDVGKAPALTPKQTKKVGAVMHEFKTGTLHSGKGGPVVKNPKQGIAIALSEAKRMKKK
jgi:hypothetical protein